MPLHWRPVGPEPESTYWQRRALAAAALVAVLVLLTALLSGGDEAPDRLAGAPASPAAATPAPTLGPGLPSPAPSPTAAAACAGAALKVEPAVGEDSYRVGTSPRLTLSVTNTGPAPCTADLGSAVVELLVFSGSDRIWSSDDCSKPGPADVTTLAPGKPVVQRVVWDGRRSRPGCTGDKERAQAGTYRVAGRVGQLRAQGEVFRLSE
jgi:hypothetical protein